LDIRPPSTTVPQADAGLLSAIIHNTPSLVFIKDLEGRYLLVNRPFVEVAGVAAGDFVGKTDAALFAPDVAARFRADDERVIRSGQPTTYEESVPYKGEQFTFVTTKFPLLDAGGRVYGVCGIATDVTASRRAERAVRESEERLRALFEQSAAGIAQIDPEGRIVLANQWFCDLVGYSRDELLGMRMQEITHPDDVGRNVDALERAKAGAGDGRYHIEKRYVRKDGSIVWVTVSSAVVRDAEGKPSAVLGVITDVSERKRTEEAHRRSEFRFQRLVEQSPLSTQVFAADGSVRQVNRAWERLWGVTLADLPDYNILHDPELERLGILPLVRRAFAGEAVTIDPIPYVPDRGQYAGQTRWCGAYVYPVRDASGAVDEVVLVHNDVTALKGAEAALRAATERWELAVNATQDGIWDWNLSTGELYWSPRCKQMLGYADDELSPVVDTVRELLHPDDRDRAWAETVRHLEGHTPGFKCEYRLRHKDGAYCWVLARGVAMRDEQGRPVRVIGSHTDITDRKRAEQALAEAEERLRLGLRAGKTGTWDWDITANRVVWSDQLYEFHGLKPGQFNGTVAEFGRLVHPDDAERVQAALQRALQGGRDYELEFRTVRPDGQVRWLATSGEVYFDGAGNPVRMLGATNDVTHRKVTEEALARSTERLELAQRAAHIGVFDWDVQTGRVVWTEEEERLFGLEPGTFEGNIDGWGRRVVPEDAQRMHREMADAMGRGQREMDFTFRIVRTDGATRRIRGNARFVYDETGKPLRMVGVNVDVTEQERLEAERGQLLEAERRARGDAEAASQAKDRFLAVLSHELRTPLTPVLATVEALAGDPALPPQFAEDVAVIRRNVELEARLIDDIIDMTRIARGKVQLHHEAVDAHASIRHALEICQAEVEAKGLELGLVLRAKRHHVWADPTRLRQVLWNVINNAVKFTPPEGRVTVRTSDGGDGRLMIEVSDSGIGITPDVLPRLFNAFEQGERAITRRFGGLGLGLTITRALVEMHGGTIEAASEGRGCGATFSLGFATVPEASPAGPEAAGRGAGPGRQGLRVLLVEDNEDTLNVMARALRGFGYSVETATGVKAALALAERERFDLLVSDIGLPDGSGWEIMRELGRKQSLRGIALSGYGLDEDVRKSHEAGFAQHLTKPVSFQTLREVLGKVARAE
jgi:PAS domain S-box-containing protein